MGNLPDKTICLNYVARNQHSFDFLVCEGARGWSATHVIAPFSLMMLLNNFWVSWLAAGVVEITETLLLTIFKSYIVFHTNDAELETKAGSLLGDWLINDLLGILAALLLLRLFNLRGLIEQWTQWLLISPKRTDGPKFPLLFRVKLGVFALAILATSFLPTWIIPAGCDNVIPSNCINMGMIAEIVVLSALLIFAWVWLFRRDLDTIYTWRGKKDYKINVMFGAWLAFVILVGLQNAQPYFPLFISLPGAEFIQVWLAVFLWAFGLIIVHIVFDSR